MADFRPDVLFRSPRISELNYVARVPGTGKLKPLTVDQFGDIQEKASFLVPSKNFPNFHHEWKLSKFLQTGAKERRDVVRYDIIILCKFSYEIVVVLFCAVATRAATRVQFPEGRPFYVFYSSFIIFLCGDMH